MRTPKTRTPKTRLRPTPESVAALAILLALPVGACAPPPAHLHPVFGSLGPSAASGSAAVVPPRTTPSLPTPELRVATYNILAAKRGIDGIAETLAATNADVIALQEVDVNTRRFGRVDLPAELGRRLQMHHAFVPHRRYQGGEIGVALLSREPIRDVERKSATDSELAMLTATVRTQRGPVRIVVVHTHPTDPRDSPKRRARFDRLRLAETTAAAELARDTPRAVVLGDFNATPGGPEYAAMQSVLSDACPRGGPTWPATFPVLTLDYIWTSSDIVALDCQTPASDASDHRPRLADLRFAPTTP